VDLPLDTPQGDGYLGVIVDENDQIDEGFEQNNASYIGLRIEGQDSDGDGNPDGGTETLYQYAAKIVCGIQSDSSDLRLRPGTFATTVNVLNPVLETVRFRKRLAVSYPPDPQRQGETYEISIDSLDGLRALETNCDDLIERAFGGVPPSPYFEGFVVLTSPMSLDVTAVYTSTPNVVLAATGAGTENLTSNPRPCKPKKCGCSYDNCCCNGGGDGNGDPSDSATPSITLDVEQIRERIIEGMPPPNGGNGRADLIPVMPFDGDGTQIASSGYCVENPNNPLSRALSLRVIVRNTGDEDSGPSLTRVLFGRNGGTVPPLLSQATVNTPTLGPGEETTLTFAIPSACYGSPTEFCRFSVMVDAANPEDVDESNEANNLDVSQCLNPNVEG
jgi:hypothetical protein